MNRQGLKAEDVGAAKMGRDGDLRGRRRGRADWKLSCASSKELASRSGPQRGHLGR